MKFRWVLICGIPAGIVWPTSISEERHSLDQYHGSLRANTEK